MKTTRLPHLLAITLVFGLGLCFVARAADVPASESLATTASANALDRTVLPIPEPHYPHSTVLDARDATPPPRFEVKAPDGHRRAYRPRG